MALDAAFLRGLVKEIRSEILDMKVDKVYQPGKDEIVLALRGFGISANLLLTCNPNNARLNLIGQKRENPAAPPMFCMLLRKHLLGAKVADLYQEGFERAATLCFSGYNDFNEPVKKYLTLEIMGRHSNLIFYNEDRTIIDAARHVDITQSRQRQVLPGLRYEAPPGQDKKNPLALTEGELAALVNASEDKKAEKYLLDRLLGLSPLVLREMVFRACNQTDILISQLDEIQRKRLKVALASLFERLRKDEYEPVMLLSAADQKPKEFTFLPVVQYGTEMVPRRMEGFSVLLDEFYRTRDKMERLHQKSQDILKVLTNATARVSKKLSAQTMELSTAQDREPLKMYGDLLMANLHMLKKGMERCTVQNYYDPEGKPVTIELDGKLSPSQNAQKYYKEYNRAKNREHFLKEQIQRGEEELVYLDSVFDNLAKAENDGEFNELRRELYEQGYISRRGPDQKKKKPAPTAPMRFVSSDGFDILVGKNNLQNDRLTLKTAARNDIWFHVKNSPGSHTLVVTRGEPVPDRTLSEAAMLAAFHSKVKEGQNVPVDYTAAKNVKKPAGAKPGMVIYENYKTAYVTPSAALVEKLRAR